MSDSRLKLEVTGKCVKLCTIIIFLGMFGDCASNGAISSTLAGMLKGKDEPQCFLKACLDDWEVF